MLLAVSLPVSCGGTPDAPEDIGVAASDAMAASTLNVQHYDVTYSGNDGRLGHQIGTRHALGWRAYPGMPPAQYMTYGPYKRDLAPGRYVVTFEFVMLNGAFVASGQVLELNVYSIQLNRTLAARTIQRFEFGDTGEAHPFSIAFDNPGGTPLEFRVLWFGGDIVHTRTRVRPIDEGQLGLLWNRRVGLGPERIVGTGAIEPKGGVWHITSRNYGARPATVPVATAQQLCGTGAIGVDYSTSRDRRASESGKATVILPSYDPNRPDGCAVVDGAMFFDATDQNGWPATVAEPWHMLNQCLPTQWGPGRGWQMCHYTASQPQGPWRFQPSHTVRPSSLWTPICAGTGKSCPNSPGSVFDEGTPDFLFKYKGYRYFSFHGYDGVRGYRGAARTKDFMTWETRGPKLPGDAMITSRDCAATVPGCIGGGASSILKSGDYYYMLIETPTKNLACTPGQNWPFMLFRSLDIARSGRWEAYPGNPFIPDPYFAAQPNSAFCGLQYAQWIQDASADIYLQYQDTLAGKTRLRPLQKPTAVRRYLASQLYHLIGRAEGTSWSGTVLDGPGVLAYGPYVRDLPQRALTASFYLAVDNNSAGDNHIFTLDVFDATSGDILAARTIERSEMPSADKLSAFSLRFSTVGRAGHAIETRVIATGTTYLRLDRVEIF